LPSNGKPFVPGDPRRNNNGRPKKPSFAERMEKEFGGVIRDSEGKPLPFDDALAKKIVRIAIEDNDRGMLKFVYRLMSEGENTPDPELSEVKLSAERARAAKLEIANEKARGELINRVLVARVMGRIYAAHQANFLSIGPTSAGIIAAELGIKNDTQRIKIEELITKDTYQALSAIKREINDFLINIKSAPIVDDPIITKRKKQK